MNTEAALFLRLLGAAFDRLDAPLRQIHGGASGEYRGTASVERGGGWLASLACSLARLPRDTPEAPIRFCLQCDGQGEIWTRHFNGSDPMTSRVWQEGRYLVERLGPATLRFSLSERDGILHWKAEGLSVLGIPIPRRAFDFQARVRGRGARYRFEIDARTALVGRLIRYRGVLDVTR